MRLSVILPLSGVVDTLDDCLRSVAEQKMEFFEVTVVDSGASLASRRVAQAWVDRDPRFGIMSVPRGSTGAALDAGLQDAVGLFLMFLLPEDRLAPDALGNLTDSVMTSGSAIAVGNAAADADRVTAEHPAVVPSFRTALFRTGFWYAHSYRFGDEAHPWPTFAGRVFAEAPAIDLLTAAVVGPAVATSDGSATHRA